MDRAKVKNLQDWLQAYGSRVAGRRFVARPSRTTCVVVEATSNVAGVLTDAAVKVLLHDEGSYVLVLSARAAINCVMFVGDRAATLADRLRTQVRATHGLEATLKRARRVDTNAWMPTILATTLSHQGRLGLFVAATRVTSLRARFAIRGNRFVFAAADLALVTGPEPDPRYRQLPRAAWKVRYVDVDGNTGGHVVVRALDKNEALAIVGPRATKVSVTRVRQPVKRSRAVVISRDLHPIATNRRRTTDGRGAYGLRYENLRPPKRDPVMPARRAGPFGQHRRRKN